MTRKDKLKVLRDFWLKYKSMGDTYQIRRVCPFNEPEHGGDLPCSALCGEFEELDTRPYDDYEWEDYEDWFMSCPCHHFGVHDAITRLRVTLEKEGVI